MSGQGLLDKTLRILEEYGIRPSRRLGQCYVIDPELMACILDAAKIEPEDVVLEIGAGTGTLTARLAEVAKRVIAVEKDGNAARALRDLFSGRSNVEVVNDDILLMDLPCVDRIVSNLPYSISTPITFKLLLYGDFGSAVLTYQKEVADRLVARPGGRDYSRLSVTASLLAEIEKVRNFPPDSFYPKPMVESTVVVVRRKGRGEFDWRFLDGTLKTLFSQRRRTLRKAMATYSKIKKVEFEDIAKVIDEGLMDTRVFEIQPSDFVRISESLKKVSGAPA
ncbi:MAG: ribosomal RNA small subunit methyltransferase A [Candidatus Verstraetearchaeota archaeon]|nr:ribosomal RNA small subunit methyltransferase A [Candidatus Verstraetearchaeota archaeon]